MVEIKCKKCDAIFTVEGFVPEDMKCFCDSEEFEIKEIKKAIIA